MLGVPCYLGLAFPAILFCASRSFAKSVPAVLSCVVHGALDEFLARHGLHLIAGATFSCHFRLSRLAAPEATTHK